MNDNLVLLKSGAMEALAAKDFPRVIRYTVGDGKSFAGCGEALHALRINGEDVPVPTEAVTARFTENRAVYEMDARGSAVSARLTAELEVQDNTLRFRITEIESGIPPWKPCPSPATACCRSIPARKVPA